MKLLLDDFILDWNTSHKHFIFAAEEAPAIGRPVAVEIRYSAARYQDFFSTDKWRALNDIVEASSHGTMYIVTSEHLFERGIIEIKIAAMNHNYQERIIVGVLRWIGEGFFPKH